MSMVILITAAIPIYAAENKTFHDIEEVEMYLTRSSDGTIHLDDEAAVKDGYAADVVNDISQKLEVFNRFIEAGKAYSDEEFNIYFTVNSLTRSGEVVIKANAVGQTEVYLTASEAAEMIEIFEKAGGNFAKLLQLIDPAGGSPYSDTTLAAMGIVAGAGLLCFGYAAQIKLVSSNGTKPIILQSNYNFDTGTTIITFHPA